MNVLGLVFLTSVGHSAVVSSQEGLSQLVDGPYGVKTFVVLQSTSSSCKSPFGFDLEGDLTRLEVPLDSDLAKDLGMDKCPQYAVFKRPLRQLSTEMIGNRTFELTEKSDLAEFFSVSLGVFNDHTAPIEFFWVGNSGEMVPQHRLAVGENIWIESFVGHNFIAMDETNGKEVNSFRVRGDGLWSVRGEQWTRVIPSSKSADDPLPEVMPIPQNDIDQRDLVPSITGKCYEKVRLPEQVWRIIRGYWEENKNNPHLEGFSEGFDYINFWKNRVEMVTLPEPHAACGLKQRIFSLLKPTLEKWSGLELEHTDFYGIRVYRNGNYLLNHVDRPSTHVISIIINVDQEVNEPWELEVIDKKDNKFHAIMAPGDMIIYESASCLHGRPKPLNGSFFANAFGHYRPVSGWYQCDFIDSPRCKPKGKLSWAHEDHLHVEL